MCVFAGFFLVSGVFGELCRTGLKCRFSGDFRRFLLRMCVHIFENVWWRPKKPIFLRNCATANVEYQGLSEIWRSVRYMKFWVVQVKVVGYQASCPRKWVLHIKGDEYQKRCTSGILRRLITGWAVRMAHQRWRVSVDMYSLAGQLGWVSG